MNDNIRVAVVGDSISEGLGSKKYNYINSLIECLKQKSIDVEVKNYSKSGTTIDYAIGIIDDIKLFAPDCILILYGNVEAIVRPNINKKNIITAMLPKRYKKIFMLDPRPFYSRNLLKSIIQHLDTCYRYVMKKLVFCSSGSFKLMTEDEFKLKYDYFVKAANKFTDGVLCVSNVRIDERYFPKSSESLAEYRTIIQKVANENHVFYINLYEWQSQFEWSHIYGNDHYHPNQEGYIKMGAYFADEIIGVLDKVGKLKCAF